MVDTDERGELGVSLLRISDVSLDVIHEKTLHSNLDMAFKPLYRPSKPLNMPIIGDHIFIDIFSNLCYCIHNCVLLIRYVYI